MSEQSPQEFHQPKEGGPSPLYGKLLSKMVELTQLKGSRVETAGRYGFEDLDPNIPMGKSVELGFQNNEKYIRFLVSVSDERAISLFRQQQARDETDLVEAAYIRILIGVNQNPFEFIEIDGFLNSDSKRFTDFWVRLNASQSEAMMQEELKKLGLVMNGLNKGIYSKQITLEQEQKILEYMDFMEEYGTVLDEPSST